MVEGLFYTGLWYVLHVSHTPYFIVLSARLSVTRTICLHFYFLVSRPGTRRRQFPSTSFCLYGVARMFIARAKCVLMYVIVAALCSSRSLKIISNGDGQLCMKLEDQWVKGNKIPRVELNTIRL